MRFSDPSMDRNWIVTLFVLNQQARRFRVTRKAQPPGWLRHKKCSNSEMKMNRLRNGALGNANEKVGSFSSVRNRKNCSVQTQTTRARPRKVLAAAREATTTIAARVDVGFGNTLFIRGQGEGLSWDKGQPLVCVDGANWVWSRRPATGPVTFKLLINDQLWCRGDNFQVDAGCHLEVEPGF